MKIEGKPEESGVYLVRDLSDGSIEVGQLYITENKGVLSTSTHGSWSFFGSGQTLSLEDAPKHIEPICKLDLTKMAGIVERVNAEEFPTNKLIIFQVIAEKTW